MPNRRATGETRRPAPEGDPASEPFFRALVEHLPIVTHVVGLTGDRASLYVSPQVEGLLGYPAVEWEAGYPDLYHRSIHPDDRARVTAEADRWYTNPSEPWRREYRSGGKTSSARQRRGTGRSSRSFH